MSGYQISPDFEYPVSSGSNNHPGIEFYTRLDCFIKKRVTKNIFFIIKWSSLAVSGYQKAGYRSRSQLSNILGSHLVFVWILDGRLHTVVRISNYH